MAGRTLARYARFYMNGYDFSGDARSIGPLDWTFPEVDITGLSDAIHGYLPGQPSINIGALNANFTDYAATHLVVIGDANKGSEGTVLIPIGMRAAPAIGDIAFMGQFRQKDFVSAVSKAGEVTISMPFAGWDVTSSSLLYHDPWGLLIHNNAAETAVNDSNNGFDSGSGGTTTLGGYAVFQLFAYTGGTGPTLKVQHFTSNTPASFADLLSSGVMATAGTAVLVALANTASVYQFLRWNVVLNGASSVTFAIGMVRNTVN
jgi:hypothetical protein